MECLERRHLLLRLATADKHTEPCIDFSDVRHTAEELDSLVTMHHLYLPILEECEYIRWNHETDQITKGPQFDELEPFLKVLHDLQRDLLTEQVWPMSVRLYDLMRVLLCPEGSTA